MVVSCSFTFGEANYNSLPCRSKTNHERSTAPSEINVLKATLVISTVAFQFAQYQNHLGYPIVKMPYTSYWHELSFPPANEPLLFVFAQIFNQHRILKHLSSQPTFCSTYAILKRCREI